VSLLSENEFNWIAAELACELNSIRRQERMSINAIRKALEHIPGAKNLTMRYGLGGRTQIFTINDEEVEVGPDATAADIEAALESKKKVQRLSTQ